jgi:hypothetical protein
MDVVERVAEWRKLKAVESRKASRNIRAAETARLSTVGRGPGGGGIHVSWLGYEYTCLGWVMNTRILVGL